MNQKLQLTWEPLTLDLRTTFRVAHGASDQRYNVIAHLNEGIGEAAVVPYYGDTQAGIMDYLAAAAESLLAEPALEDPARLDDILRRLLPGSRAARAAVDIALHDLWGKQLGQPLYRLFGLNPESIPPTSFTIAIDEPQAMAERARQSGLPVLKIKLGTDNDIAILSAMRQATDARLRGDANGGWTRQQAAEIIPRLAEFGLELIEQPLPMSDQEGFRWLRDEMCRQGVSTPIFADESVKSARDVALLAGAVDGVVIKLMKTGGLREALRAIHTARALDMQVMLSCMVESSVGVTAAAHLAPLCDYIDLDGPLLVSNDPYQGVRYEGAKMILPDGPGIGVTR